MTHVFTITIHQANMRGLLIIYQLCRVFCLCVMEDSATISLEQQHLHKGNVRGKVADHPRLGKIHRQQKQNLEIIASKALGHGGA